MANENETVAKLAVDALHTETISLAPKQVIVKRGPCGTELIPTKGLLDAYADRPDRIAGTATLYDIASFIEYVNRHKNPSSAIFLNPDRSAPKLIGVIDYHEKANGTLPDIAPLPSGGARFGVHRASYAFPVSDEWTAWTVQDAEPMTQEAFAAFLEDHVMDVIDPINTEPNVTAFGNKLGLKFADGASLITLSRGLSMTATYNMNTKTDLASGEATFQFTEEHKDASGAALKIPGAFAIAIPVFRAGQRMQIAVRLRYRVQPGGKVSWFFQLYGSDAVFDAAIEASRKVVAEETELDVFAGTPEQK